MSTVVASFLLTKSLFHRELPFSVSSTLLLNYVYFPFVTAFELCKCFCFFFFGFFLFKLQCFVGYHSTFDL